MEKAVVLVSIGSYGYGYMAHNLAYSIKEHSPELHVHLVCDKHSMSAIDRSVWPFDSVNTIPDEDTHTNGKIDPCKIKTHIYDLLPAKHNLYLDVDALALRDIQPFFDSCISDERFYLTEVNGKGTQADTKINYNIWAANEDIADFFKLDPDQEIVAIQSSWCYIQKGRDSKKFFKAVESNFARGFPMAKLTQRWGATIPDELLFSGTLSKMNIDPSFKQKPIFFGHKGARHTPAGKVKEQFPILAIYGTGSGNTTTLPKYWDLYDKELMIMKRKNNDRHIYKGSIIKKFKYAG